MPRPLVWAQLALYLSAAYAITHGFLQGRVPAWELLIGAWQLLGAYGVANEGRWGWRMGIAAAGAGLLPPVHQLVLDPSLLLHPDFLVLLALPLAAVWFLLEPEARDHQRAWFR